ncbi:MAG: thioredoxin domain-containing protein [Bdellovibrionales bacterium]|nr:thioredoxin domain-containing protein [Bdellovibrionales bacterium]
MKNKVFVYLAAGAVIIALFVAVSLLYKKSEKEKLNFLASAQSELFVRDHSPRYGDKEAKVILTEFLDPECESCRAFYPAVKSLLNDFEGKVQLVVRYAPFHQNSKTAIRALEAARLQGKYWQALEMLFHYQPEWGNHHNPRPERIFEFLQALDLDMEQLKADMNAQKIDAIIMQDEQDLRALNVRGTPTFFVNGKPLEDFGMDSLRALLKQEVDSQY